MTLATINLHDAGLQVALDGELVRTSPGFAVLNKQQLLLGEAATAAARRLPQWTNNRFWAQLDTHPLANRTAQVRHHADLAFAHLEALWRPISKEADEAILCVPSYYTAENLGLLLGMAKECGIPVKGMVDQSLLAAAGLASPNNLLHLDVHLHGITLTRLTNSGLLVRREVNTLAETGLVSLWEKWANLVAKQFIQTTRFDPMHDAAVEQQLFDLLPGWIRSLKAGALAPFELSLGAARHAVNISPESLLAAVNPLYPHIVQAIRQEAVPEQPTQLLVSYAFTGFPGLKDSLGLISDLDLVYLDERKTVASALAYKDEIVSPEGAISHVVQLSRNGQAPAAPKQKAKAHPTHLLFGHRAYPVGSSFRLSADFTSQAAPLAPAEAGKDQQPCCTFYLRAQRMMLEAHQQGVSVNGEAVTSPVPLHPGDTVTVGDQALTMIAVAPDG